jgi:hypothetical protein
VRWVIPSAVIPKMLMEFMYFDFNFTGTFTFLRNLVLDGGGGGLDLDTISL